MANPNAIPPEHTQFQPGRSGNPGGRPKGVMTDAVEALIAGKETEKQLAEKWLALALAGDFRYFKELIDRRDGKVADRHEHEFSQLTDDDLIARARALFERAGITGPEDPPEA